MDLYIGLLGAIIGGLIASLSNWLSINKEAKVRIHERLFERRIQAYENVVSFARKLNSVVQTDNIGEDGYVKTYNGFLQDQDHFNALKKMLYQANDPLSYMLDIKVVRELRYIQDYFGNLQKVLDENDISNYPKVAVEIQPDLRELSENLRKSADKFFENEITSLNIKPQKGSPKLTEKEFNARFSKTKLFKLIRK